MKDFNRDPLGFNEPQSHNQEQTNSFDKIVLVKNVATHTLSLLKIFNNYNFREHTTATYPDIFYKFIANVSPIDQFAIKQNTHLLFWYTYLIKELGHNEFLIEKMNTIKDNISDFEKELDMCKQFFTSGFNNAIKYIINHKGPNYDLGSGELYILVHEFNLGESLTLNILNYFKKRVDFSEYSFLMNRVDEIKAHGTMVH